VLSDELASLKAEVEELTVSHDLEVERLQERLGQLQTVQDKLELALREKKVEHEKAELDTDAFEAQKHEKLSEQKESAAFNLRESNSMLRDASAALKRESKTKVEVEQVCAETRRELDELLRDFKAKEAELTAKVTEEGTLKERRDANMAAERVRDEEALSTLKAQLAEAKVMLKESEGKATSFAKEYGKEFYLRKQIAEQVQELTGGLRVFCRIRAPLPDEAEGDTHSVTALDDTTVLLQDKVDTRRPTRRFEFNQVYHPGVDTAKLFADVEPLVAQTLDGINVCVLAYGPSSSGKTHTLCGAGGAAEQGLLQASISSLFDRVAAAGEARQHEAFLSVLEIVGETLRDLQLEKGAAQPTLEIVRDPIYGMVVQNLSTSLVHTASHVRSLLAQADERRTRTGAPSHLVCSLSVRILDTETGEAMVGQMTMVDLASSESAAKGVETPDASLAALHAVVAARAKGGKDARSAPIGSSLLTTLLQESLTGNSKTAMLVTVAPTQTAAAAAGAALEFGVKARAVSLGPASKNKESMQTAMNKVNTTMSALAEHAGGSTQRRGPMPKNR
jgi:kinesin family protein C1